jgi:hypothetical protein
VYFLWGVLWTPGGMRPEILGPVGVWKKSAPPRAVFTAYGDSVASDCGSSAALSHPGARIAAQGDMRDGATAK